MPSPFPGMDPCLEDPALWSDFHSSFLLYLRNAILDRLPDNYEARIDEKINLVETGPDRIRLMESDLSLSQDRPSVRGAIPSGRLATLEPVTIPHLLIEEEQHERRIEILYRPERSLVAVLEVLSPANKEEPGLHRYRDKRHALLKQAIHLVEIDLLIGGTRLTLRDSLPPADYYVLLSRGDRRPDCQVWAWTLSQPLPPIPIPLKAPDPDVSISLQDVFATTYDKGRYVRSLHYGAPPRVPLPAKTREWVVKQVSSLHSGSIVQASAREITDTSRSAPAGRSGPQFMTPG